MLCVFDFRFYSECKPGRRQCFKARVAWPSLYHPQALYDAALMNNAQPYVL